MLKVHHRSQISMRIWKVGEPRCDISTIEELIEVYKQCGGYMAKHCADAAEILLEMCKSDDLIILSFPANLVATGLRSILSDFIRRGFADVVITTAGTLDHDIAKSLGGEYMSYKFNVNDIELREDGYHRIGNIIVRVEHYGPLIEKFVHNVLMRELEKRNILEIGVRELLHIAGSLLNDPNSILRACYERRVPIYVLGYVDGAFGTAVLTYNEVQRSVGKHKVRIDLFRDEEELENIVRQSKDVGCIIVGGGVSGKHVETLLHGKKVRHAVLISSTSYELPVIDYEEGVLVYSDATIVLPILFSYVTAKLKSRVRKTLECLKWNTS